MFMFKEKQIMTRRRATDFKLDVCQDDFVCHKHTRFVMALNPVSVVHSMGLLMSYMIRVN